MRPFLVALSLLVAPLALASAGDLALAGCGLPQDDAGSGRDASALDPVALAAGTHRACQDDLDHGDVYSVALAAGEKVRVVATPDGCDGAWIDVEDRSTGRHLTQGYSSGCGDARVGWSGPGEILLDVRVGAGSDGPRRSTLVVEIGPDVTGLCGAAQDDGASGADSGGGLTVDLSAPGGSGCLDVFDRFDGYSVQLQEGDLLRATLVPHGPNCDGLGWYVGAARGFGRSPSCEPLVLGAEARAPTLAHLGVWAAGESTYDVALEIASDLPRLCRPHDDAALGRDATREAAIELAPGTARGCVDAFDVQDWWSFTVPAGRSWEITMRPLEPCPSLVGLRFDAERRSGSGTASYGCAPLSWSAGGAAEATGFLAIEALEGTSGHYELVVEECATPGVTLLEGLWLDGRPFRARVPSCNVP